MTLPQKAVSSDGYIINQGLLGAIPYAKRDSAYCGCGWIAVFNLFRALGLDKPWDEIRNDIQKYAILGGRFGTNPFSIRRYIRRTFKTKLMLTPKKAIANADKITHGIVMYRHGNGGHYVMFTNNKNGTFRFYNAIYGAENYNLSMADFLAKHNKFGLLYMIAL
jgi:hypothetical protein